MDPEKVSAVKEWPTPSSQKQLQWFLGFANVYRKFIKGFSSISSPLHSLTSSKAVCLVSARRKGISRVKGEVYDHTYTDITGS